MATQILPLYNLADRHPGLTSSLADSYLEAACVCLDRHHEPPQDFQIKNQSIEQLARVDWETPDERCKKAWANENDATRDGAYACALAAAELSMGMVAVGRAETITGADYYIAPIDSQIDDLEDCFRVEISGTNLNAYEVRSRVKKKVNQAKKGNSNLPALAIVVGFQVKLIFMQSVEETL